MTTGWPEDATATKASPAFMHDHHVWLEGVKVGLWCGFVFGFVVGALVSGIIFVIV